MRDKHDGYDARYTAYMNSPEWGQKRLEAFKKYGEKCQACGNMRNLTVHHADYRHIGNEPMEDLRVLCKKCHKALHKRFEKHKHTQLRLFTNNFINERFQPKRKKNVRYMSGKTLYDKEKRNNRLSLELSTGSYCVDDESLL